MDKIHFLLLIFRLFFVLGWSKPANNEGEAKKRFLFIQKKLHLYINEKLQKQCILHIDNRVDLEYPGKDNTDDWSKISGQQFSINAVILKKVI